MTLLIVEQCIDDVMRICDNVWLGWAWAGL